MNQNVVINQPTVTNGTMYTKKRMAAVEIKLNETPATERTVVLAVHSMIVGGADLLEIAEFFTELATHLKD